MTMATQQTQQILTKDSENNLSKEHPMETVAKKKTPEHNKEEHSICGPHIQILLAVGVFLAFTAFLVYHLMEDNPYKGIGQEESWAPLTIWLLMSAAVCQYTYRLELK